MNCPKNFIAQVLRKAIQARRKGAQMVRTMEMSSRRITAENMDMVINLQIPPSVQRANLLYQWFRTNPVVESGKMIVCR